MSTAQASRRSGRRTSRAQWLTMVILSLACLALDRLTKAWALRSLDPDNPPSYLGGFLRFVLTFNSGAAFSMGERFTVGISVLAIAALIGVLCFGWPRVRTGLQAVAAGLLVAGIAGNLIDRLTRPPHPLAGYVTDFIALPHFAIFNIADICITGAAVLFVWISLRSDLSRAASSDDADEDGSAPAAADKGRGE